MISYNLNLPNGPDNPSIDQPGMQVNTNSIATFVAVDHVGFETSGSPNGYHTIIHQVPTSGDPVKIAGIGQIYTKNVTVNSVTDTQLFYETGLGGISQLSGNSAGTNGYQWIGGILLQWGLTTASGTGSRTISFLTPPNFMFPNNCFQVIAQMQNIANVTASWAVTAITQSGFTLLTTPSAIPSGTPFSWFAIGN